MGRKPLPKNKRREVVSISLKPAIIAALDTLRGEEPRSRWIEAILEQRINLPVWGVICGKCEYEWTLSKMTKREKSHRRQDPSKFTCPNGCDVLLTVERLN